MTSATAISLKRVSGELLEILGALRRLDEKAAGLEPNAWLREEIKIMRGPGRERDRRVKLAEADAQRERDIKAFEREYSQIVGRDVPVDRQRIRATMMWLANLLREIGTPNV